MPGEINKCKPRDRHNNTGERDATNKTQPHLQTPHSHSRTHTLTHLVLGHRARRGEGCKRLGHDAMDGTSSETTSHGDKRANAARPQLDPDLRMPMQRTATNQG